MFITNLHVQVLTEKWETRLTHCIDKSTQPCACILPCMPTAKTTTSWFHNPSYTFCILGLITC